MKESGPKDYYTVTVKLLSLQLCNDVCIVYAFPWQKKIKEHHFLVGIQ
jgi:hypothetical protein